jgi:hypothetical protein
MHIGIVALQLKVRQIVILGRNVICTYTKVCDGPVVLICIALVRSARFLFGLSFFRSRSVFQLRALFRNGSAMAYNLC